MRITRIEIKNFRSIRHVTIDLGDATVFVGPNNAGKTAILDALRIALTRRWGQRGTGFGEYDIHLADEAADPRTSGGVSVELMSEESEPGDWPGAVSDALADVVHLDPGTLRRRVVLRARYAWNDDAGAFEPAWEFLGPKRDPVVGPGAPGANLESFWRYLPVFHLGALRDVSDELSPRSSQFWGRLLRALEIPEDIESEAARLLDQLDQRLTKADPRLEGIANTLSEATRVAARDQAGGLGLRMTPLKPRDLLDGAEIIMRNDPGSPWLPLRRQGQGLQSLSVIFLFQVFVEHLLGELYETDTEPLLALEEPETHLHPQAVRTLWRHIQRLPGQKVVTTHSPYFVQHVPFRDLRLVRLTPDGTVVRSLPASFSVSFPNVDGLDQVVTDAGMPLFYQAATETLTVHGALDEGAYRRLLSLCGTARNRFHLERRVGDLKDRSSLYVTDEELLTLETYARRMRGEILFAECWIIVEGQSDHLIVHAIAAALDYDLDRRGVSVIDAQNNGDPATFAVLARALDIPWLAVFDGDAAGMRMKRSIGKRGFGDGELEERCRTHVAGDLEAQLVADGLEAELGEVLASLGIPESGDPGSGELAGTLRAHRTAYAAELSARIRRDPDLARRAPMAFRETIEHLPGLA